MRTSNFYAGKYIFITGGSEGIGRALALELTRSGADVTIFARSSQKLEITLKEMETFRCTPDQKLNYAICDVTQFETVKTVFDHLISEYRVPDILMNVAGYAQAGYIHEQEIVHFDDMINLNLFGCVHTCKAIAPYFMKNRSGMIMNTSSMAGFLGLFGYTAYCSSKFAVMGFSEALYRELKPFGIHVSVLCPPNTRTPGLEKENLTKPIEVLKTEEKAQVVTAELVAVAALKNLKKRKRIIIPTLDGRLAHCLSRISPRIIDFFVNRKMETMPK